MAKKRIALRWVAAIPRNASVDSPAPANGIIGASTDGGGSACVGVNRREIASKNSGQSNRTPMLARLSFTFLDLKCSELISFKTVFTRPRPVADMVEVFQTP